MAAQLFPGTALGTLLIAELSSNGCIKETKVYGFVKKYTFVAMVFSALWLFSAAALFTRVFSLSDVVYCAVPFYVFGTAVFIMTAYLSYFGDFIIPALYSLISSALVPLMVYAAPDMTPGSYALMISFGSVVSALLIFSRAARRSPPDSSECVSLPFSRIAKSYIPMTMAGVFIPAGALMLSFFSRGGGNAVAFGFCVRLIFALVAAFSFGFSRVLYPEFSRDGRAQLSHSFVRALRSCGLLILLFTPVIAAVFIKGETVFSAFFMRGRFDENAVALLARAFRGAVFSVPALCVCEIMSKLCFACGIKWAPGVCNIIGIAVTFFMLLGFSGSDIVMPAASFSAGAAVSSLLLTVSIYMISRKEARAG